ncbi:hypothetical protein LSH36_3g26066 [Paralvinella palmiformis]|uniref:L-aminoadipate-semialdehyde dehydrogenase-phosphopantetheinyl transferase n=1 Tax=Paralvinella palmiformis TaxID=53620 RepID=A0AAD9NHM8_9ANNE|nr:hypothetical protein LSH36_3g26066 [Paralvinella palmiformis]
METIRWAFRLADWHPSKEQWLIASSCIQAEEKNRIGKFVFQKDAKSALIGRLLLRRVVHKVLHIPYKSIHLSRTNKGKPYLVSKPGYESPLHFNVSHQGEYAVLAADPVHEVGIDVMQVEYPRGSRSVDDFFSNMNRQFTQNEWLTIKDPIDEWDQLKQFYRFWCLKESYVKALGVGIGFSLQRLDFCPQADPEVNRVICNTKVCVDDALQRDWLFEETMLDNKHCVAVALKQNSHGALPTEGSSFQILNFEELLSGAEPLTEPDSAYWQQFNAKQEKPMATK